jgi:hypothetical protein
MSTPSLHGHEIRTIYDLLDLVRVRPGMWIGHPSVDALQVFLSGFCAGLHAAHASLEQESPCFRDFHGWIAQRLGMRMNGKGWATMLFEACGTEAAAFERFWTELDAFRKGAV